MFVVTSYTKNGFDIIALKDVEGNCFTEIIPACGGILHSFNIWHNEAYLNVIDSYDSKPDFDENLTNKGFKGSKLSPFACRLKNASYQFGESSYQIDKFLLKGHAMHGLIYDAPFSVSYQYADEAHAGVAIEYKYRGTENGYPFFYDCVITYHLKKNNELIISTDIFNKDECLLPVQDGWHPYFTFGRNINDLLLEFQSSEQLVFDEEMIPTGNAIRYEAFGALKKIGETIFDDCFSLNFEECQPLCVIRDTEKKLQIEIRPDKSYPYLQIYTPDHRQSIAIENLSAPPNAFNNGIELSIVPPKGNVIFTTTYKVSVIK